MQAFLAVACLFGVGCSAEKGADDAPPNIVLVSIDSLRARNLGCYGYPKPTSPFIDELAQGGVLFENAVSTTTWTLPAHAAMFTGLYDSAHGLYDNGQRLGDGHTTLAEQLRDHGYATAGFFGGPYLHPTFGLDQGFDVYKSCMTTTSDAASADEVRKGAQEVSGASHEDITGPRTRREIAQWASQAGDEPYFLFVHLWDVHYDYIPPAEYVEMFDPDYTGDLTGENFTTNPRIKQGLNERDLQHLLALYDGEIRFTDDILRGIFDDLEAQGLLENTLVIITADHGEEFYEHGRVGHQGVPFEEVLHVPLIVHWPEEIEGGKRVTDQVRLIDLAPTLYDILGITSDRPHSGRSLRPLLEGQPLPAESALAELLIRQMQVRALRTNEAKLIRAQPDQPGFLFRLPSDPGEREPLGVGSPHDSERVRLEEELSAVARQAEAIRAQLGAGAVEGADVSPELDSQLKGLGYGGEE